MKTASHPALEWVHTNKCAGTTRDIIRNVLSEEDSGNFQRREPWNPTDLSDLSELRRSVGHCRRKIKYAEFARAGEFKVYRGKQEWPHLLAMQEGPGKGDNIMGTLNVKAKIMSCIQKVLEQGSI